MEFLFTPEVLISLLTLTALEVVLGLDNIIFITILSSRLPKEQREKARKLGLVGAFGTRLILLSVVSYLVRLTAPLFTAFGVDFSGKSVILLTGGLFLLYKATKEIHEKIEAEDEVYDAKAPARSLSKVVIQIMILDLVFSIDSVITAVGLTQFISIMVIANVIALGIMLWMSGVIGEFVEKHPSVKILALSFLMMIGFVLVAEGWGVHIPKGYIYFSMGFSIFVEMINIRIAKNSSPLKLHDSPTIAESKIGS